MGVSMTDAPAALEPMGKGEVGFECIGVNLLQPVDYYYTPK